MLHGRKLKAENFDQQPIEEIEEDTGSYFGTEPHTLPDIPDAAPLTGTTE